MASIVDFQERIGSQIAAKKRTEEVPQEPLPNALLSFRLLLVSGLIEGGAIITNLMASMLNVGQHYDTTLGIFHNIAAVMAAVPFIIMAMVEFSKIPLALALLNTRWFWRPLIALALVGMSAITFETLVMGLERASSLQARKIEALRIEISETEAKMFGNKDEKAALKTQRDDLNAEIEAINKQQRADMAMLDERFKGIMEGVNQRRKALENQIAANREAERDNLKMHTERAIKTTGGVSAKYAADVSAKAKAERDELQRQLAAIIDPADFTTERADIQARFDRQRAALQETLRQLTPPPPTANAELRQQLDRQNSEISTLINENQLYRLAASIHGHDKVSDVTKEEVKNVATIWFSSVAALGAFAGPVLALSSVAVTRIRKPVDSKAKRMFYNALRVLVARLRRRARVQVIKEVPVEVEVPRVIKVIEEVERPVDRVVEVERIVNVEVPVEKIVEVERVVERVVKVVEPIPVFREDVHGAAALARMGK